MEQLNEISPTNVNLIGQVKAYEDAHNKYDVTAVMALFADDAVFELVGQGTLPNLDAIRAIHEYDKAIHAQIDFQSCIAAGNQVTCAVVEQNEWLKIAGLEDIYYPATVFTFTKSGKIQKIAATISTDDGAAMGTVLADFILWIMAEQPNAATDLFTSEGVFIYNGTNGTLVLDLLAQWRAESQNTI